MTMRQKYLKALTAAAAMLTLLPLPQTAAQDARSSTDSGQMTSRTVYEDYNRSVKTLRAEHRRKLAEIDRQYEEALRRFSAESSRRAQALTDTNTAEHNALAAKRLAGAERRQEYERVQAEDKRRSR